MTITVKKGEEIGVAKISKDGIIELPNDIMKMMDLGNGSEVEFYEEDGKIYLRKFQP